jgi:hypothetical protein
MSITKIHYEAYKHFVLHSNCKKEIINFINKNYPEQEEGIWIDINGIIISNANEVLWDKIDEAMATEPFVAEMPDYIRMSIAKNDQDFDLKLTKFYDAKNDYFVNSGYDSIYLLNVYNITNKNKDTLILNGKHTKTFQEWKATIPKYIKDMIAPVSVNMTPLQPVEVKKKPNNGLLSICGELNQLSIDDFDYVIVYREDEVVELTTSEFLSQCVVDNEVCNLEALFTNEDDEWSMMDECVLGVDAWHINNRKLGIETWYEK